MYMVIEREYFVFRTVQMLRADYLIHNLPYPIKRIRIGAQIGFN